MKASDNPFATFSLSTDIWPAEERWDNWKRHIEKSLPYQCDMTLRTDKEKFTGKFHVAQNTLTGDAFSNSQYSGNLVTRNKNHLQDNYVDYLLAYVIAGKGNLQRGKQLTKVSPGGIYLLDMSQTFAHDMFSHSQIVFNRIPRQKIEHILHGPGDNQVLELQTERGPGFLLQKYLQMLPRAIAQSSRASAEHLFNPITDLVIASLVDNQDAEEVSEESRLESLFQQIQLYMLDSCTNPALSIDDLCQHMQLSRSYIHRIFNLHGRTFTQELRRIRIERACTLLNNNEDVQSLTHVANHCGFNGLSQFSRAFKQEIGVSARDFRQDGVPAFYNS